MKSFRALLITWNATHNERVKLQYAYVTAAVIGIFAAGLVAFVDARLSRIIADVSLMALAVFAINVLAWALLYGLVISKVPSAPARPTTLRRKK